MLVLGLWANGRPVRFLVIGLSALGLDLFVLGAQSALTLAEPVRVLIAFLGLSLLAGAPLAGFALFSPVARARREARSKTHGEEIAVPPGSPPTPTDNAPALTPEQTASLLDPPPPPPEYRSPTSLRKRFGPGHRASDPDRRRRRDERTHRS